MKFIKTLKVAKTKETSAVMSKTSLYEIEIKGIDGLPLNLTDYKGKHLLFVNVASKCGFTKQYKELQALHEQFVDSLTLIGVPCNQFGGQEPGKPAEIQSFCERNFGVTFLLTEKIAVKGNDQHPLYRWLTQKASNGKLSAAVKWNFQKYLVNPKGELVDVFYSITKPTSNKITKHFK